MPETMLAGLLFLINTVFDLYLFVLIVRVILVWSGANYFHPVTQFIVKLTDFLVKPLRRIIPNVRGIELSSVFLIIVLEIIKFLVVTTLSYGMPNILGVIVLALADFFKLIILTFFYAILLQAILSWIQPRSPMNRILYRKSLLPLCGPYIALFHLSVDLILRRYPH